MPDVSTYLLFVGTCLAILLTPGPAVLYIVATSVEQGRKAGLVSALGLAAGGLVHLVAAVVGLSALLAASPGALRAVQLAGAGYLIYLGLRTLFARGGEGDDSSAAVRRPLARTFRDGVVVNVLNPKAALFYLAFLPQFVDPAAGRVASQILFLGLTMETLGLATDSLYALAAGGLAARLRCRPGLAGYGRWVAASVYLALGAAAALGGPASAE